jgi:hypothetical protein
MFHNQHNIKHSFYTTPFIHVSQSAYYQTQFLYYSIWKSKGKIILENICQSSLKGEGIIAPKYLNIQVEAVSVFLTGVPNLPML